MQPLGSSPPVVDPPVEPVRSPWYHKLGVFLFIIVCFEVGVFLLVFPWMDYWSSNSIASLAPWMPDIWDSPFFRGALSGLGLLNIYISLVEVFRLRRPPAGKLKVSVL